MLWKSAEHTTPISKVRVEKNRFSLDFKLWNPKESLRHQRANDWPLKSGLFNKIHCKPMKCERMPFEANGVS